MFYVDQEEEGVESIVTVDCELRLQQMMKRFTDARVLNFEVRKHAMRRMAWSSARGLHGFFLRHPGRAESTTSFRPVRTRPRSTSSAP
jgi:hypothetical protein